MGNPDFIRLVPLMCPRCGSDIGIGVYDRTFVCRRCMSAWEADGDALIEKTLVWGMAKEPAPCYVPFWVFHMTAETPQGRIEDFHSYCGYIAFPEHLNDRRNRPLSLFVLAAHLSVERPRLLISRRFNYSQPVLETDRPRSGRIWGPYLNEEYARRYARVIFISTLSEVRKGSREFIAGLSITLTHPRLVFVPFVERDNDYQDTTGMIALSKKFIAHHPENLSP